MERSGLRKLIENSMNCLKIEEVHEIDEKWGVGGDLYILIKIASLFTKWAFFTAIGFFERKNNIRRLRKGGIYKIQV